MADNSFTPQVPDRNPESFMGYSHPISQPMTDVSGKTRGEAKKILGEGLGQDIDIAAHLTNTVEQRYISEGIRADSSQQEYAERLSQVDDVLSRQPGDVLGPKAASEGMPSELQKFPGVVDDLIAIRDSGKLSPTHYRILQDNTLQGWRSRFPGQRDFIDTHGERIMEDSSANRKIQSLTADINSSVAAYKSERGKMDAKFLEAAMEDNTLVKTYKSWKSGKIDDYEALTRFSARKTWRSEKQDEDLAMSNQIKKTQIGEAEATKRIGDLVYKDAAHALGDLELDMPELKGEKLGQFLTEWQAGKHPVNSATGIRIRQWIDGHSTAWVINMMLEGTKIDPTTGYSRAYAMGGPDKYRELVNNAAKEMFGNIAEQFSKEAIPAAVASKSIAEGLKHDATIELYRQYPWMPGMAAGMEALGKSPAAADWLIKFMIDPAVNDSLKPFVVSNNWAIGSQPLLGTKGAVFNLDQAVESTRNVRGSDGANVRNNIINSTANLAASKAPEEMKANAIRAISDPNGRAFLDKIAPDGFTVDPSNGMIRIKPGKNTALSTLTSDGVMKEAAKQSPALQQQYVEAVRQFYGSSLSTSTETLNKYAVDPNVKFSWDSENKKVAVHFPGYDKPFLQGGMGESIATDWMRASQGSINPLQTMTRFINAGPFGLEKAQIQFHTNQMNQALQSMTNLEKHFGNQDVDVAMLELFVKSGVRPDDGTIPGQILTALIAANSGNVSMAGDKDTSRKEEAKPAEKETYGMTPAELSEREEETK